MNWDMSEERQFMENIVCQRFNFFLVFFGLVVGTCFLTKEPLHLRMVLGGGTAITMLLGLTIARGQQKMDMAFARLPDAHPARQLANDAWGFSMRWLIGYGIPLLCTLFLIGLNILAWKEILVIK